MVNSAYACQPSISVYDVENKIVDLNIYTLSTIPDIAQKGESINEYFKIRDNHLGGFVDMSVFVKENLPNHYDNRFEVAHIVLIPNELIFENQTEIGYEVEITFENNNILSLRTDLIELY